MVLGNANTIQRELFKKTFGIDIGYFVDHLKEKRDYTRAIDVIVLGKYLACRDPEYDREHCMYKGETCYTINYIRIKFGDNIAQLINDLIDSKFENDDYRKKS